MRSIKIIGQRGDTIVEVLIAIAVLGGVLGTSYAIVGANTRSYQQINERTEALKLAEGQLEMLGSIANGTDIARKNSVFSGATPFCIDAGSVTSGVCNVGPNNRYEVSVTRFGPGNDRFEAVVEWDSLSGGTDRVSLFYRVNQ